MTFFLIKSMEKIRLSIFVETDNFPTRQAC
jgi:hypothetical protein